MKCETTWGKGERGGGGAEGMYQRSRVSLCLLAAAAHEFPSSQKKKKKERKKKGLALTYGEHFGVCVSS